MTGPPFLTGGLLSERRGGDEVGLNCLSRLYEVGGLIADRDGDGLPDSVTARVLIDRRGTVADFVAAANFAARLGYAVVRYEPGLAAVDDGGRGEAGVSGRTVVRFGLSPERLQSLAKQVVGRRIEAGQGLVAIAGGELVAGGTNDEGRRRAGLFLARDWPGFGPPNDGAPTVRTLAGTGSPTGVAGHAPGRVLAVILGPAQRVEAVLARPDGGTGTVSWDISSGSPLIQATRPFARGFIDLAEPFAAGNLVSGPPAADGAPGGERPLCALLLDQDATSAGAAAACEVACRLGVEASEIELPLAFATSEAPEGMRAIRFEETESGPGEVLADERGLVLRGGAEGLAAAAKALALSFRAPGEEAVPTGFSGLAAVRRSLVDFLALRSGAGQVAGAAAVLAAERGAQAGVGAAATVRLDDPSSRARAFLEARAGSPVEVAPLDETIVSGRFEAAWEVDALKAAWTDALAALDKERPAGPVAVSAGVGEPGEIRGRVVADMARDLAARGYGQADFRLEVLSAYKPGLSWLSEVVIPDLKRLGLGAEARVVIRFAPCIRPEGGEPPAAAGPSTGKWLEFPIRWLQELYPADDLIARELGIPADHVIFEMAETLAPVGPTYTVAAYRDEERVPGSPTAYSASFSPPVAERPYLNAFPEEGLVHPTTGWLRVESAGRLLFEQRIETDLERVWGFLQRDFLPAVTAEVKAAGGPQPFFEVMDFEVWASEADEPLGLREERFSPLEALHEDVYFVTLDHFAALGRSLTGQPFRAPGPVLPWIHRRLGAGPEVRARLVRRVRPPANPLTPSAVTIERVEVEGAGRPGRVVFDCAFAAPGDATAAAERLAMAGDLQAAGISGADLALPAGCALECRLTAPGAGPLTVVVAGPGPRDEGAVAPGSPAGSNRHPPKPRDPRTPRDPIVPYDHVLTLSEGRAILDRLASFPQARVWPAGRSFQGRPSYCLEVVEVGEGSPGRETGEGRPVRAGPGVISRNKLRLLRPTLVIVARHHANEVSSSNAALRLAEDLLTGPAGAELRRQVNLVVIPFENVDGVALHERMEKEHPTWKLHAARFNAAGQDVAGAYGDPGTPFGESRVLPLVWDIWRPDVISDEHGVPSHEWDQPFAGYVCRSYSSFWLPRAFFYVYLSYLDDPAYPGREAFSAAMRERVAGALARDGEISAWNRVWRRRYEKYGHAWMPKEYPAPPSDYHRDLLVYFTAVKRDEKGGFQRRLPGSNIVSWVSEVNDETAQGDYLALCARAHYLADEAVLRLLADGPWEVVRETTTVETPTGRAVRRSLRRPRPPKS